MLIKQYQKQGHIAWSNSKNHSELLASASFQQDQGLYHLDLLSLDLQERSKNINVIGNGYTDNAFRCIAWDNYGEKQNLYSYGLIFTGMENGSFKLWNPNEMINTYHSRETPHLENIQQQTSIIYEEEAEDSAFPVMCGQWNSLKNNFLAFGAYEVLILDISKDPSDPQLIKLGKKNPHDGSYVTSVSWNREVPHILASASENGLVALWDIKTNNSIFQFKDSGFSSSGNRNVTICWSKNISTQIAVTLDDQKKNELQIWDLRYKKGPVIVIDKHHSKGISCMDWCQTDPELILTSSRDNKVICWNYTQQDEPLNQTKMEVSTFNVKWSKKLPSIYSISTEDSTSVYTLNDTNLFSYVPKWYKVPVGSTFFGNQTVLTYSQQRGNVLHQNEIVQTNKKSVLKPKLKSLMNIIEGKFDQSENESSLSLLIKAKSSNDNDNEIYDYFGFNKDKIVQEVEKYTGKKQEVNTGNKKKQKNVKPKPKTYIQLQGKQAIDFFTTINSQGFDISNQNEQQQNHENVEYDMVPRNFNWDIGKQKIVKQNILIGNYQGAIDAALKCGRTAQALIIAYSVDQNLFNNTLKAFFTETTDNFITDILKHIAYKDAVELVKKYKLQKWKQCVSLIYSIVSRDKRPALLKLLAQRLRNQIQYSQIQNSKQLLPQDYPPIICYILAQNFTQICNIYYNNLSLLKSGTIQRKLNAIEYGRRLIEIYQHQTTQTSNLTIFKKIVRQVAFISIEEGEKVIAHSLFTNYLQNGVHNQKYIDYLINTTKQLQKYRESIHYKPIVLPVMQPKKIEKKANKQEQNKQKPSNKMINKEQNQIKQPVQSIAPPPPIKRKPQTQNLQPSSGGFSPYGNNQNTPKQAPVQQAVLKKNLNVPPPPPPSQIKKERQPNHQIQDEESQKEIPPPPQQIKSFIENPKRKNIPPPPSPPQHEEQQQEQPPKKIIKKPPVKAQQPPSPPPPIISQKNTFNPPTSQTKIHSPPPPPPPAQRKHDTQQNQDVQQPHIKQPPNIKKKNSPPPPPPPPSAKKISQSQKIPEKQQYTLQPPPPSNKKLPPPQMKAVDQPPKRLTQPLPPTKKIAQQKSFTKYEQPQSNANEDPFVRRTPPPTRKGPPPPPPPRR